MDTGPRNIAYTIIIPAYNEEEGIGVVLDRVFRVVDETYEVIVVDDGSSDQTAQVTSRFPCTNLQHSRNYGKGTALRTGIRAARGHNIIWIDADATYPPEAIPLLANRLDDSFDLVYSSRRWGRGRIPLFNRVGNGLFRLATRWFYGFELPDPCSGLCAVRKEHLECMELQSVKFSIESEIAMKAGRMRLRMCDVPVEYRPRIGQSKLNGIRAGFEITWAILRHLFWRPKPESDMVGTRAVGTQEDSGR